MFRRNVEPTASNMVELVSTIYDPYLKMFRMYFYSTKKLGGFIRAIIA